MIRSIFDNIPYALNTRPLRRLRKITIHAESLIGLFQAMQKYPTIQMSVTDESLPSDLKVVAVRPALYLDTLEIVVESQSFGYVEAGQGIPELPLTLRSEYVPVQQREWISVEQINAALVMIEKYAPASTEATNVVTSLCDLRLRVQTNGKYPIAFTD